MGLNGPKCSQSLDRTHLEPAGGLARLTVSGQTLAGMLWESKVAILVVARGLGHVWEVWARS